MAGNPFTFQRLLPSSDKVSSPIFALLNAAASCASSNGLVCAVLALVPPECTMEDSSTVPLMLHGLIADRRATLSSAQCKR